MAKLTRVVPCLWFADEAEPAARFHTGVFPNSRIAVARGGAPAPGPESHGT